MSAKQAEHAGRRRSMSFQTQKPVAARRRLDTEVSVCQPITTAKTAVIEEPISRNGKCAFVPGKNDAKASFIKETWYGARQDISKSAIFDKNLLQGGGVIIK